VSKWDLGNATCLYLNDVPVGVFRAEMNLVLNRFRRAEDAFAGSRIYPA